MNSTDRDMEFVESEELAFDDHQRKARERWSTTYSRKALKQGALVDDRIVKHPRFEELIGGLDRMFLLSKELRQPIGGVIHGGAGVGKTTLCRFFRETLPQHDLAQRSFGMIYLRMRRDSSLATVIQQILKQLDYPLIKINKNTLDSKRAISIDALRRHKTRLLLIDEAHHMTTVRVSEYLRELMDELQIAICLVGGSPLGYLHKIDPYLDSRCVVKESLRDFPLDEGWLALAQTLLPDSGAMNLKTVQQSREGQKALHQTARGNLRRLKQFLTEFTMVSVDAGASAAETVNLRLAFRRAFGTEELSSCPW